MKHYLIKNAGSKSEHLLKPKSKFLFLIDMQYKSKRDFGFIFL